MKGGAYGAGATASGLEKVFSFSSYRDPNIRGTLDAFREALDFAGRTTLSAGELEQVLLGTAGKEDRPLAPGEKGFVALKRTLLGISDASRQERRNAILATGAAQVRAAALRLAEAMDSGRTAVLTGSRALEKEAESLGEVAANRVELPE